MSRHLLRPKTKRLIHARARTAIAWQHNGTWTINGVNMLNTPTPGVELILTPDFAADTNWNKGAGWTITGGVLVATAVAGNTPVTANSAANVFANGVWYQVQYNIVSISGTFQSRAGTGFGTVIFSSTTTGIKTPTLRAPSAIGFSFTGANPTTGSIDDASVKALTHNQLYAVRSGRSLPSSVHANGSISPGSWAGTVYGLDSISAPTNCIIAIHDGVTGIKLEKMVAGVWTAVLTTTSTYVAGMLPEIRWMSADTFGLFYNNVQKGASQTISDAGTGLLHGVISTSVLNNIYGVFVN